MSYFERLKSSLLIPKFLSFISVFRMTGHANSASVLEKTTRSLAPPFETSTGRCHLNLLLKKSLNFFKKNTIF